MRTSIHNVFVLCVAAVMADGVLVGLGSTLSPGLSVAESSICDVALELVRLPPSALWSKVTLTYPDNNRSEIYDHSHLN